MKIRNLFAALPLLVSPLWAASDVVLPEQLFPQLDAILQQAVSQSPAMLNRALDLEIAENNRIAARAGLLPSIGGYYSYRQAKDDRGDQPDTLDVTKVGYDLSVSQPLYHWGERSNNARIGEIQANMAKGNYRNGYRLLAQNVRRDYLGLIVLKHGVKRARLSLEYSNTQLKQAEERLAKTVISEAEIFGYRLGAEQTLIAKEQAEFAFEEAKLSFARLTGTNLLADGSIPDAVPTVAYNEAPFGRMLASFLGQNDPPTPEAFALRQQIEIQDLSYANQKTRLRPKFNASVGINQDEQSYTTNLQKYTVTSTYIGVTAYWTIFDGFAAGAGQRSALAQRRQLENNYRALTESLARSAQSGVKYINFAARTMAVQEKLLTSAEGNLNSKQQEFDRGLSSETDVSQARIGLYSAQANAFNARIDFLMKVGDFLGTVVEDPVVNKLAEK